MCPILVSILRLLLKLSWTEYVCQPVKLLFTFPGDKVALDTRMDLEIQRASISEIHSPKTLAVILLIILLSITDAYLTLDLISRGAVELNPIMAYYLDHSVLAFFGTKYLLTCASIILILFIKDLYLFRTRVQGKILFVFHLIVLTSVVKWELYLLLVFQP